MRITNGMAMNGYLRNMNKSMSSMVKLQDQMASTKRLNKLSDDPVAAVGVMRYRNKLNMSAQYKENVEKGLTWLQQTESSMMELNGVLKTAYETAIQSSNDFFSPEDKEAAAALIGQLRDHVITIGNAKSGTKFIFGGYNTNKAPFAVDASGNILYNGLDMTDTTNADLIAESGVSIEYEMGFNLQINVSANGTELLGMGDNNIYKILDDMYNALKSDASADELSGFADKILAGQTRVLSSVTDIGGRVNRLELISNRYDEDELMYTDLKSKLEDVDQAEAIMNFKMAEFVYNATLQIGSSIIQPSLADFLK